MIEPGTGALGSKDEWGVGPPRRAARPAAPPSRRPCRPAHGHLVGLKVLVTAGGTREPIDSVRFVGNRSRGRMGFALAEEAAALGADVTVIAANVGLARNPRVRYVDVATAAELKDACEREFARADVLLMAAAVADFRPAEAAQTQAQEGRERDAHAHARAHRRRHLPRSPPRAGRRRRSSASPPSTARARSPTAATSSRARASTRSSSTTSRRPDIGFEGAENEVTIVTAAGERHVPRTSKAEVARAVLETVDDLRTEQRATA